ncbi:MAG TPA: GNAT family N-acetyltransferase [Acidimicrobiales bacterium]|nr:GNAT family N-acetyltransferase [Acidimicrobiales bacterium]
MTGFELRRPTEADIPALYRVSIHGYGMDDSDEVIAHAQRVNELDRTIGAWADGAWVGCASAYSFEVTLPGGACVPTAGVTMVGVAATHRRRGILTAMLDWLHDDAVHRGESLAALTASEASIYRRFGYGITTQTCVLHLPTDAVDFDPPVPRTGTFRLLDPHDDIAPLARLYDRVRHDRPGWISRNAAFWENVRLDPPHDREGHTSLRAVVHLDEAGDVDGYATWRIAESTVARVADNTVRLDELVGLTPDTECALWRFCAEIDLVTTVTWQAPEADPLLRWRLVEPRKLRIEAPSDLVWTRLLDVTSVLSARTYGAEGSLTIGVRDDRLAQTGGSFRLTVDEPGGVGRCERIGDARLDDADLVGDVADVSSLALGAVPATTLAAAGRLAGLPDALRLADALFASAPPPSCSVEF